MWKVFASITLICLLLSASISFAQQNPPPPSPNDGQHGDGQRGDGRRGDGQRNRDNNHNNQNQAGAVAIEEALLVYAGGDHTFDDLTADAFAHALNNLNDAQITAHDEGDEFFAMVFEPLGTVDAISDGLGPILNATSCEGCHVADGRGQPLAQGGGLLIRLAINQQGLHGETLADPIYGGQLQDMSIAGYQAEGSIAIEYTEVSGTFADGTPYSLRAPSYRIEGLSDGALADGITYSPRVGNQIYGLGLLEAISEDTILAVADPNDSNGDGISGKPNYVWDFFNNQLALGYFGWKANQPHLLQQTAGAFNGDMGLTTSIFMGNPCTAAQVDCLGLPNGGTPEVTNEVLQKVAFYTQTLGVPAQRNTTSPQFQSGEALFVQAQCSTCHLPQVTTGIHPTVPQLSNQTIAPFTDLLLHDMGEGLADGQLDFQASGSEWRTAPLWGIGLFETVNGHTYYLHDGRARNLSEAILWHGGEAQASRDAFIGMSATDREALLTYLASI